MAKGKLRTCESCGQPKYLQWGERCGPCNRLRAKEVYAKLVAEGATWYCRNCNTVQSITEFRAEGGRKDSVNPRCGTCRYLKQAALNRKKPLSEVTALYLAQAGRCGICGDLFTEATGRTLDHCHVTDALRAFLCRNCNFGLGNAKDTPQILINLSEYLRGHTEKMQQVQAA